jgi:hypothetical protein
VESGQPVTASHWSRVAAQERLGQRTGRAAGQSVLAGQLLTDAAQSPLGQRMMAGGAQPVLRSRQPSELAAHWPLGQRKGRVALGQPEPRPRVG